MKELIIAVRYLAGVSLQRLGWWVLPDTGKDDYADLLFKEVNLRNDELWRGGSI